MITIAIPVYNTEKYIRRCLESVLSQTFQNLEILVINDCCTDSSIEIVKSIEKENKTPIQIRIINQEENKGIAAARNRAILEAKGEFFYFLDSDDLIVPNCMEILHNAIQTYKSEFVIGSYCYYKENECNNKKDAIYEYGEIKSNEDFFRYKYAYTKHALFSIYIWNILFNINFLKRHHLLFKPVRRGEDHIFFLEMMPRITSCIILPNVTYHYIQRKGSLSMYSYRNLIPTKEIDESIDRFKQELDIILKWKKNPFFPEIVYQQIRDGIWMSTSIIRKKSIIKPFFPHQAITILCKHPLSITEIFKLKRKRLFHLTFYIFGRLPLFIKEFLIQQYSKKR